MKCRACWTDKAYLRDVSGWRGKLHRWLGMVPLKCHHCYHKFSVPWFATIGKRLTPPALAPKPMVPTAVADQHAPLGQKRGNAETAGKRWRSAA